MATAPRARYADCIRRVASLAGRALTDDEIAKIFTRVHQAALDIKAGRAAPADATLGPRLGKALGVGKTADPLVQQAAQRAAAELEAEAAQKARQANLQLVALGARLGDYDALQAQGAAPMERPRLMIARDFSGRYNIKSLEQMVAGYVGLYRSRIMATFDALGNDFLGFWQDRDKALDLIRALRGEPVKNPENAALAQKGARAWAETTEEMRQAFNQVGGTIGRLDDWGFPQHHNQETVSQARAILKAKLGDQAVTAATDQEAYVNYMMPILQRTRAQGRYYVDEFGMPWDDARLREFLEAAWLTIATDGIANIQPGKPTGIGKRANRHAEQRQIHFPDAEAVIDYWDTFGGATLVEILDGHVATLARDIAFVEQMGPNPNTTYQTLRDTALREAALADPNKTQQYQSEAVALDNLYDYAAGSMKPTYRQWLRNTADSIASLNVAGKLGGAALASLYGDKLMLMAVSHMNDIPQYQQWVTELAMLNPANKTERRLLQQQGLMLDSLRSGLQRFNDNLGTTNFAGKMASAIMRISGMNLVNDGRKGAFGLNMFSAIGNQIADGRTFATLEESDVRALRTFGVTEENWKIWQLAKLEKFPYGNDNVLTPENVARVTDDELRAAGAIAQTATADEAAQARRRAIVSLLGIVNTESDFAIVTPGWSERALFYADLQRGTWKGEIGRAVLQFKSFPWALFKRSMDAIANQDGPVGKAAMASWIIATTTLAGAMLIQTREMLAGKDPRSMVDENWMKFWGAAFITGGALGIYGDFLYGANQTRYGSGILEAIAGPTIGPLLELGLVQPMGAIRAQMEGRESHLGAQTIADLKGYVPGNNLWYTKAATDHLVWQRIMDMVSPGYLRNIREKTRKEFGQNWYWPPGQPVPERAPALEEMWAR